MMINEDYFIKYLKNELTEEETRQLIAWVKEGMKKGPKPGEGKEGESGLPFLAEGLLCISQL